MYISKKKLTKIIDFAKKHSEIPAEDLVELIYHETRKLALPIHRGLGDVSVKPLPERWAPVETIQDVPEIPEEVCRGIAEKTQHSIRKAVQHESDRV